MTTQATAPSVFQETLTAAGFATEDDLHTAAREAPAGTVERRILFRYVMAFGELEMAERQIDAALAKAASEVAHQIENRATGRFFDPTWIAQAAEQAKQAKADRDAAVEKIRVLHWVRQGTES